MLPPSEKRRLQSLNDQLSAYLQRLASPSQVGRFIPCEIGASQVAAALVMTGESPYRKGLKT
jgi:hypothetical protein